MSYNKLRFAPLKNDNPLSFFLTLRNVRCQLIIILLAGVVIAGCNGKPDSDMKQSDEQMLSEKTDTMQIHPDPAERNGVQWVHSVSDGLRLAKEQDKLLLVVFSADWCGWCKKMDKDTFGNSEVIKLSDNFINVKINTDKNPEDARKYKVRGLPTIIFLKSNGEIIEKVVGYRGSKDFISIIKGVIEK